MAIQKAVRYQRKLRVGAGGPTGSGKTLTCLKAASYIAKQIGGRVGVIDTENFSSSVYADEYDFDVCELTTFAPDNYIEAISEFEREAKKTGVPYVLIVDSLSHAWMGKGGSLEQVDKKVLGGSDSFTAWRTITPQHNRLVEKLINYDGHLFLTMRSKMEHAIEKDERTNKNKVVKLGMAPIMRDGIEYEVDVYFEIDQDHNLTVTKTRFTSLDGYQVHKAGDELAERLWQGSQGAGDAPERPMPEPEPERVDQYGQFRKGQSYDQQAFIAYVVAQGLATKDLALVAPVKEGKGTVDVGAWLKSNPTLTLTDLVKRCIDAKHDAEQAAIPDPEPQPEPAGEATAEPTQEPEQPAMELDAARAPVGAHP